MRYIWAGQEGASDRGGDHHTDKCGGEELREGVGAWSNGRDMSFPDEDISRIRSGRREYKIAKMHSWQLDAPNEIPASSRRGTTMKYDPRSCRPHWHS